jgi:TolB protein
VTNRRNLLFGTIALAASHISPLLALDVDVSGGRRRSIAVLSFNANTKSEITIARGCVANIEVDLIDAGLFNVASSNIYVHADAVPDFDFWRRRMIGALVVGRVSVLLRTSLKIEFRVWDVMAGQQKTGGMHFAELDNWPPVAHLISETITSALR